MSAAEPELPKRPSDARTARQHHANRDYASEPMFDDEQFGLADSYSL